MEVTPPPPVEPTPTPLEVMPPEPRKPDSIVTQEDAVRAAKGLGLAPVRIRRLSRNAIVGQFMSQLGATKVGQGMLLMADQQIEKGIKMCDNYIEQYPHEPDVIAAIMRVRLGLVEAMMKLAHTHIKVNKDSGAVDLELAPQNRAFPASVPVSQNVQVNLMAPTPPER